MIVTGGLQGYFPTQRNIAWARDYMRSLYWLVHSGLADMKICLPKTTGMTKENIVAYNNALQTKAKVQEEQ